MYYSFQTVKVCSTANRVLVFVVVVMFLSLLFSEKHCNMASVVIRSSNAFISSNNQGRPGGRGGRGG